MLNETFGSDSLPEKVFAENKNVIAKSIRFLVPHGIHNGGHVSVFQHVKPALTLMTSGRSAAVGTQRNRALFIRLFFFAFAAHYLFHCADKYKHVVRGVALES